MQHTLDQLRMHVPYFRSAFMRNALPISGVRRNESVRKPERCEGS